MPIACVFQAAAALLAIPWPSQLCVALIIVLLIIKRLRSVAKDSHVPPSLPCSMMKTIPAFFHARFDLLNWGFHATGKSIYQFHLLTTKVIVLSGERARLAYFGNKNFDLTQGSNLLSVVPEFPGITSELRPETIGKIHRRLGEIQRSTFLSSLIPRVLDDCRIKLGRWEARGCANPFDVVYDVIFQLTVRCLSGPELADDGDVVARLKRQYDILAETTPSTVLLPWLPTPAMVRKLCATKAVYDTVVAALDARERGGCARDDTMQLLLDAGDDRATVIGFIMGLLVAGARATGTTASWLVVYLSAYPEWRAKAKEEILRLLATHSSEPTTSPLHSRLADVPLEAWEADTPVVDALIRETLRIAQPHTAIRKNLGPDTFIDGQLVPAGAHVVYPFSDVHLDDTLYPSPWTFDPTRPARQGKMEYLGFGGGNTVCLGNRLAKMMIKLFVGMFLLGFDSSIVDPAGAEVAEAPVPDWNDAVHARPARPCHLKYERTELSL